MLVFTSITNSYIPKARVLAKSLKQHNPDWEFWVVLSDIPPPGFDLAKEPFDAILTIDQIAIPNWKSWAFGHSIVELCTAVKGPAAQHLADRGGTNKIVYIDPDIKIFSSLDPLEKLLDTHDILLTPHLLHPEVSKQAVIENEICTLQHGCFNLGFFSARTTGQGREFIDWWAARLSEFCVDDIPMGLFTDQRWCDLAPCFFDGLHIIRDPGYNVATWNVAHRRMTRAPDGAILAGQYPLRFYHFTGYDSGDGLGMLKRYADDQPVAREVWVEYGRDLRDVGHGDPAFARWSFGCFDNGDLIPADLRRLYRSRKDLRDAFPDPFSVDGGCLWAWWQAESAASTQRKRQPHAQPRLDISALAKRLPQKLKAKLAAIARHSH